MGANGTEGAPGIAWRTELAPGDLISVEGATPEGVTGWNVYVGIGDGTPLLQNDAPLQTGKSWMVPASLRAGRALRAGQDPDYFVVERRILPRW